MDFKFIDPMNTDIVLDHIPKSCYLIIMSEKKYKSGDLRNSVGVVVPAYICETDSGQGYRVGFGEGGLECAQSVADDPYVIAAYSNMDNLRGFMQTLKTNEESVTLQ